MNRMIHTFLLLLIPGSMIVAQHKDAYKKEQFTLDGKTLPYRILLPENYDQGSEYPLILFLHGSGERGIDNEKQLVHGADLFLRSRKDYPAIVIFPQCPEKDYWSNVEIKKNEQGQRKFTFKDGGQPTEAMRMVSALLDSMLQLQIVDNNRVYIGGLSMGGMGTFELVSRRPGTFAAAIAICGGGNPNSVSRYAKTTPFWVFHGAQDDVVPPSLSKEMVEALQKHGATVKFTLYPNANHNSWDKAFAEPDLLKWLFSNRK